MDRAYKIWSYQLFDRISKYKNFLFKVCYVLRTTSSHYSFEKWHFTTTHSIFIPFIFVNDRRKAVQFQIPSSILTSLLLWILL